jgi:hypothetical protein
MEEEPASVTNTNEVIDMSEDVAENIALFDIFQPQSTRKTPRKKVAVEKYSDNSFLTKKTKTPKGKGSSQKKSKSGSKKRKSTEAVEPVTTSSSTVVNEDGTTTTTQILADSLQKKVFTTITVTALDGSTSSTTEESDLPHKKAKASSKDSSRSKKSSAAGSVLEKLGGKKGLPAKTQMTEAENAAFVAKQLALKASIPSLEEQEKAERERLAGMRRLKLKLEKAIEAQSKIKFPIEDTRIAAVDKKGKLMFTAATAQR